MIFSFSCFLFLIYCEFRQPFSEGSCFLFRAFWSILYSQTIIFLKIQYAVAIWPVTGQGFQNTK